MLITFTCDVYTNVVMFGKVGLRLLDMMGYPGKQSGIIHVADIAAVRSRLRHALENDKSHQTELIKKDDDDSDEPKISLQNRAFTLLEMFDVAEKEKCDVKWSTT